MTILTSQFPFLRNGYKCSITFDGEIYPSVEHAYQASKTDLERHRDEIRDAATAKDAVDLGRSLVLRRGWNMDKLAYMEDFLRQKFSNEKLMEKMSQLDDSPIKADMPSDFWGTGNIDGAGQNMLGKILTKIKDEIKSGTIKKKNYNDDDDEDYDWDYNDEEEDAKPKALPPTFVVSPDPLVRTEQYRVATVLSRADHVHTINTCAKVDLQNNQYKDITLTKDKPILSDDEKKEFDSWLK